MIINDIRILFDLQRDRETRTSRETVATCDNLSAANANKINCSILAGLKSDGGARRNIEPLPVGFSPIEVESRVGFNKVIM